MDLALTLNPNAQEPLHQQLTASLMAALKNGRLSSGQRLPSTRRLASDLGLSRDTVVRSYRDLSAQGLIKIAPGCMPRVVGQREERLARNYARDLNMSTFAHMVMSSQSSCGENDQDGKNIGVLPKCYLPVKVFRKLLSNRFVELNAQEASADEPNGFGYLPLRSAFHRFLCSAKGINCSLEELAVFSHMGSALDLIARLTINAGDKVALAATDRSGARELFRSYGAQIIDIPVDENGLDVEFLCQRTPQCRILYITPSYQAPCGAILQPDQRKKVLDWAEIFCDFIIEDAVDSDFFYGAGAVPALQGIGSRVRIFYLYSFWKLLFPIVSTACLVIPPDMVPLFQRSKPIANLSYSLTESQALTDFIVQGHVHRHLISTRNALRKRRQELIFALKQEFRNQIEIASENSGLQLTVVFFVPADSNSLLHCASQSGLKMAGTADCNIPRVKKQAYLIDFADLDELKITELVRNFAWRVKNLYTPRTQPATICVNPNSMMPIVIT